MKRGELWTASSGAGYAGKPRPVLIVQSEQFDFTDSITICPLTTTIVEAPLIRLNIEPDTGNGLLLPSALMVEKLTTINRNHVGRRIGQLTDAQMQEFSQMAITFLALQPKVYSG